MGYDDKQEQFHITTTGEGLTVRHGKAPEIFVYDGFNYTADSTDSLIALVRSKGNQPNTVIAYNENGIKAILDDTVKERIQDRINYAFKLSQQYEEWEKILTKGSAFDQRDFIKFLQRREPGEIEDIEFLIGNLQNFRYAINTAADFSRADDQNYTFMIKIGEVEGSVKLPQFLTANIEIYNESEFIQAVELELEVYKPKSEGEKPLFGLSCPKLQRYLKAAVEHEIERLKCELEGYLIVAGNI
ncbi:hypothetical protein SOV_51190 [Sporomusa ovata DSM 2662]|uniref:Uncharacterized protein n=1 Tax=Sporomusa ovata TaxID=2378 RepID=A0A0U1L0Y8_9FIRM|nr:hypothetical protein [Sporomusa ovata]EQB27492.1 hypothetical protein SOV_2c03880 [Sporomusa ovata DSM 2662]CQR73336.1 hypothetical protein SpAn4DRAFT_2568 [Sporomusa ovata]